MSRHPGRSVRLTPAFVGKPLLLSLDKLKSEFSFKVPVRRIQITVCRFLRRGLADGRRPAI